MNKINLKNKFSISESLLYFEGTIIPFEEIEFCKCIGIGANGIVFEAKDINLDRKIAVKFWNNRGRSDFKKAQNEAKKLASVDHPYFAKIFSSGVKSGLFYITMEFVNGVNLKEYLFKEPITILQRFDLYWRYSNALDAIYKNEILHGDPHTGNVMVYESSFQTPKPISSKNSYPDALPINLGFKVLDLGSSSFWEDREKFTTLD
jgi:serine/threonine protein kinase